MATTPTNSTTVSILNLPQAQLATPTDYLVLQTANGTQIISFNTLNVVKTDINGNATVVGNLTGNNATFIGGINVVSLTAAKYFTTGGQQGYTPVTPGSNYYDSFTIANGLIVSATPTSVDYSGNPLYTTLNTQITAVSSSTFTTINSVSSTLASQITSLSATTTTLVQNATAYTAASFTTQLQTFTAYSTGIYDVSLQATILQGTSSASCTWTSFFSRVPLVLANINTSSFFISPNTTTTVSFSAQPFITNITQPPGTSNLTAQVNLPYNVSTAIPFNVRLFVTYNAQP